YSTTPARVLGNSGAWSTPAPLHTMVGAVVGPSTMTQVRAHDPISSADIPPIVAESAGRIAMAFIKADNAGRRLFVFVHDGVSWTQLGAADIGGVGRDVEWGDISINVMGDIAIAYSAKDPLDFREHVYGNVFTQNHWTGVVQLDYDPLLISAPPAALTMPKV